MGSSFRAALRSFVTRWTEGDEEPPSPEVHQSPPLEVHQPPAPEVHQSPPPEVHQSPHPEVHQPPPLGVHQSPPPLEVHQSPQPLEVHQSQPPEVHQPRSPVVHQPPPLEAHQLPPPDAHHSLSQEVHQPPQAQESTVNKSPPQAVKNRLPLHWTMEDVHNLPPPQLEQFNRNQVVLEERTHRRNTIYTYVEEQRDPFQWSVQFISDECTRILGTPVCEFTKHVRMLVHLCQGLKLDPRKVLGKAERRNLAGKEYVYIPLPCATPARARASSTTLHGYRATTVHGLLCIMKAGSLLPMPEACAHEWRGPEQVAFYCLAQACKSTACFHIALAGRTGSSTSGGTPSVVQTAPTSVLCRCHCQGAWGGGERRLGEGGYHVYMYVYDAV